MSSPPADRGHWKQVSSSSVFCHQHNLLVVCHDVTMSHSPSNLMLFHAIYLASCRHGRPERRLLGVWLDRGGHLRESDDEKWRRSYFSYLALRHGETSLAISRKSLAFIPTICQYFWKHGVLCGANRYRKNCDILAAERVRLMRFDNWLIIDSFQNDSNILQW